MWYFAWILGISLAVLLAVINAMLCEAKECALRFPEQDERDRDFASGSAGSTSFNDTQGERV